MDATATMQEAPEKSSSYVNNVIFLVGTLRRYVVLMHREVEVGQGQFLTFGEP